MLIPEEEAYKVANKTFKDAQRAGIDKFNEQIDNIKTYIDNTYNSVDVSNISISNSDNVLANIRNATGIDFRPDSNKYLMVFTDDKISNLIAKDDAAARLNEVDMNLIAVTNEESKLSWRELADETSGSVFDIAEMFSVVQKYSMSFLTCSI